MTENRRLSFAPLVQEYTELLFAHLVRRVVPGPLTYGFEYEFLPSVRMTPAKVATLKRALPELGFKRQPDGTLRSLNGLDVSFEPGGQLEYGSPPLFGADEAGFAALLDHIAVTNQVLEESFGIKYQALGYRAGRTLAPLCLEGRRYQDMHNLFTDNGGRGREMMKGTASIQLHVRIRALNEMVPLFLLLQKMAHDPDFAMSASRRAIWDETEPSRCRMPEIGAPESAEVLLSHLVRHALAALDLRRRIPFAELKKHSFADFLVHLTTIFTDVRLNLKGPTFELRTMDSLPPEKFTGHWRRFVAEVEKTL
ncbi:MAG: hypothetical protein JXR80_05520 [Deltaproteobacteria bacterium]|nr:hypothetical protein [Deltaproteobacteria bacterium]